MNHSKDYIKLFEVNTDASNSIRGIYYQFLVTLNKWIENYLTKRDTIVSIEIEDDIREISDEIVFTQVKSYTSNFSLNSTEIKKSLLNFYFLFLKYESKTPLTFCFLTNTSISKSEKLLQQWISNGVSDSTLTIPIQKRIRKILKEKIKERRITLSNRASNLNEKDKIKIAEQEFISDLTTERLNDFAKCISWKFNFEDPHSEILVLEKTIRKNLKDHVFKNISVFILERILISEIYRVSKLSEENRHVTNKDLKALLEKSEDELLSLLNTKILNKIKDNYDSLEKKLDELQKNQIYIQKELNDKVEKVIREVPYHKELTLIPYESGINLFGREKDLEDFKNKLIQLTKLNLIGYPGTGKSLFAKKFIEKNKPNFDHIIWIDYFESIETLILNNTLLFENLNLSLEFNGSQKALDSLFFKLNSIKGNNIIIVDNFKNSKYLNQKFASLENWNIVLISSEQVNDFVPYKLNKLSFEGLKEIFLDNFGLSNFNNDQFLIEFFDTIDSNPLIIKLLSKTIKSHLDLDIYELHDIIKKQDLTDKALEIEIISEELKSISTIAYFIDKFRFNNLSDTSKFVLSHLSILPSQNLDITILASIGGKEHYDVNYTYYTNNINELERKGWVERNKRFVTIPKFLQSIIKYDEQISLSPFVTHSILINWLCHRITESILVDSAKAKHYLEIGEHILLSIPENFRNSVYQPLILLENEILYSYGMIFGFEKYQERWSHLLKRAKNQLNSSDPNLGVIHNNLALSYYEQDENENVINHLKKAINIYKKNLGKSSKDISKPLIISSQNLSYKCLVEKNFKSAKNNINYVFSIYNQLNKPLDYLYIVTLNLEAQLYTELFNYSKAIKSYNRAKEIYNNLNDKNQLLNTLVYGVTMTNLALCKLKSNLSIEEELITLETYSSNHRILEYNFGYKIFNSILLIYSLTRNYKKGMKLYKLIESRIK